MSHSAETLVIYHANCADGFGAAWAASRKLGRGPDVCYLAARHGDDPPDTDGLRVYILDFAYPRAALTRMYAVARSLLVLDHHKTSRDALSGLDFARFDMERSGAGMTWDHFFSEEARPPLIDYVEDGDLWAWRLPDSRLVNLSIKSRPYTFEAWDEMNATETASMIEDGRAIEAFRERQIEEAVRRAREADFFGQRVPAVQNSDSRLTSELLHRLARGRDFSVGWSLVDKDTILFSLRSEEGGADVGAFARRHGGGGHRHAAGFSAVFTPDLLDALLGGELIPSLGNDQ